MSVSIRKKDSINNIKLVGRLHSQLVGIVDLLNCCYSIQVTKIFNQKQNIFADIIRKLKENVFIQFR